MNPRELLELLSGNRAPVDPDPPVEPQDATAVAPSAIGQQGPSPVRRFINALTPEPVRSPTQQAEAARVEQGQHAIRAIPDNPISKTLRRLADSRLGRLAGDIAEFSGLNDPNMGPMAMIAGDAPAAGRALAARFGDDLAGLVRQSDEVGRGAPGRLPELPRDPLETPAFMRRDKGKVVGAAIRTPEGEVYEGVNHAAAAWSAPQTEVIRAGKYEDGFITDQGRFVTRAEATATAGSPRPFHSDDLHVIPRPRATVNPNADLTAPAYTRRGPDRSAEMGALRQQGQGGMLPEGYLRPSRKRLGPGEDLEKVTAAATRVDADGSVFEGAFHGESRKAAWRDGKLSSPYEEAGTTDGFITNRGRFVTREEAAQMGGKGPSAESEDFNQFRSIVPLGALGAAQHGGLLGTTEQPSIDPFARWR